MTDAIKPDKPRILLIEDSEATQRLVRMCLCRRGHSLTSRDTGPAGLEEALAEDYDLILLDIALPGMDGWEVLRQIRASDHRNDPRVIVLTAHHDTILTPDPHLLESVKAFVPKPFEIADFERIVEQVLAEAADA